MAQAVFPNGFFLDNTQGSGFLVRRHDLEGYLQNLPERVQSVFRQRIASLAPLQEYRFTTRINTRQYTEIGQMWANRVYEMSDRLDRNDLFGSVDTTSPYYLRVETDPERVEEIPTQPSVTYQPVPREVGCFEKFLRSLDDFIIRVFNAVKYFFSLIFAPCLPGIN